MRVDNHGIQWRVCATIVLLYTYTESVEEKNMGKKWKKKEKRSWLDLNSAPLCCEDSV